MEKKSAIETAILSTLVYGERERFVLPPTGVDHIRVSLRRVLETSNAADELYRIFQLTAALSTRLGSPSAARAIREIVASNHRALQVIRSRWAKARAEREHNARRLVQGGPSRSDEQPPAAPVPSIELYDFRVQKKVNGFSRLRPYKLK